MISSLVIMWLSGGLIGFGLAVQWGKIAKMHADERLVERNTYLEGEVTRLRAQVALHVGATPYHPANYPVGQSIVASAAGAR